MAFPFPLQAIFHFRQSVEHQQEMNLRAANQRVARVRHLIEQLDQGLRQAHALCFEDVTAHPTGAELHFALVREASLRQQREILERERLRLENLRDQQQRAYRHARQQREIIESLRARQLDEYHREQLRREQRQLDDFFLLQKSYLRRG